MLIHMLTDRASILFRMSAVSLVPDSHYDSSRGQPTVADLGAPKAPRRERPSGLERMWWEEEEDGAGLGDLSKPAGNVTHRECRKG